MVVSYIIGVHNEESYYIDRLLSHLLKHKDEEDEIIIVDDFSTNESTIESLDRFKDKVQIHQHALDGDFAAHKNYMNSLAKGDWIFNIDADENLNELLIKTVKEIIICNPSVEAYRVPRINIVPDITEEDMKAYGWQFFPDTNYINMPDYQTRIYKNSPSISWGGRVHEQLIGFKHHTDLPYLTEEGKVDPSYCIIHIKTADRQRVQNKFYASMVHS